MAMDGPQGKVFSSLPTVAASPQKMPMRQESSRQTMFAASPRNVPVINKSLISPPPIASTPLIFSKSSTRTRIVPATTKAPSRASCSAASGSCAKSRLPIETTIPATINRSGMICPSKSANALASSRLTKMAYLSAWREI